MQQIGLVTGGGTGPELARAFRLAAEAFTDVRGERADIVECPARFTSFSELQGLTADECARIVERDLAELARFYRGFYARGGRLIFRTAVNAETLYALRRQLEAVKVTHLTLGNCRVTLVRDQHQGFYACDSWEQGDGTIRFTGSFQQASLRRIFQFAAAESAAWLGPDAETWFVYKYHLFGNRFASWITEICPRAAVLQPGMAYAKLASRMAGNGRPLLLIAGNEIGDLLQEVFLDGSAGEHREISYSRNIYLHPEVAGLVEYQTVHGSADDLAGQQRVNPLATLRAAAALFEEGLGFPGVMAALEEAMAGALGDGLLRPPASITLPTEETARQIVSRAVRIYRGRSREAAKPATAR